MRTAFQVPFDATVRISLDTNLTMVYERDEGTRRRRSSCVGAWSESARLTPGASAASERIRLTTPTVETVMREAGMAQSVRSPLTASSIAP